MHDGECCPTLVEGQRVRLAHCKCEPLFGLTYIRHEGRRRPAPGTVGARDEFAAERTSAVPEFSRGESGGTFRWPLERDYVYDFDNETERMSMDQG